MGDLGHLARRFLGSLRPAGPRRADADWAQRQLLPAEAELWRRMSGPDRRHSIEVSRRVDHALGGDASRATLAAALLHDVGKVAARLGTYGRVIVTLLVKVVGRNRVASWSDRQGFARRASLYVGHPRIGAALLERAGSEPLTAAWAREHHLPEERWTVPRHVGDALKAADDD